MRRPRSLLFVLLPLALFACESMPGSDDFLHLVPSSRLTQYGEADYGTAELRLRADYVEGDQLATLARTTFDPGADSRVWFEFPLLSWNDTDGRDWDVSTTGDYAFGVLQRIQGIPQAVEGGTLQPALAIEVFGTAGHGLPKPPRLPGLIEGEEGYFAVSSAEWSGRGLEGNEVTLALNAGGGIGGVIGRASRTGRAIFGAGLTQALGKPGIGFSTESMKLGVETFWVLDFAASREFGELSLGLAVPIGSYEVDFGARFGLTDETEDLRFYVGFAARMFEALL